MKSRAIKMLCLTLLLCSTAFAKPPKCKCYYYQLPHCYTTGTVYCLQYPLLAEDQDGMNYFVYDTCTTNGAGNPCNMASPNNYGWALSSRPYPQTCMGEGGGNGDCETEMPSRYLYKGSLRAAPHQLSKPIREKADLKELMKSKHSSMVRVKSAGGKKKWDPRDGIVSEEVPIFVKVAGVEARPIPVKLFKAKVHFMKAARAANPEIKQDELYFQMKPDATSIMFGAEFELDENHPPVWLQEEPFVSTGSEEFSGIITVGGEKYSIVTNRKLR